MQGVVFDTKNKVLRFSPKDVHMVAPYTGERFSISAYTVSDLGKLTGEDIQLLSDLGYPIYNDAPRTFGKKGDGIYSIGHSDLSIQTFLERLTEHGISDLIDVRSDPHSARYPHYNREELAATCFSRGIVYTHAPELGNRNHGGIQANLQTGRGKETIARITGEAHDTYHRIVIFCSEASWRRCHRQDIANHLRVRSDKTVGHIRADGSLEPHPLHHAHIGEEMQGTDPQPVAAPCIVTHSHPRWGRMLRYDR